jgi:hypothetical protein
MESKLTTCIEEATSKISIEVLNNGTLAGLREREELLAEISFKAGRNFMLKEVREWVEQHRHLGEKDYIILSERGWQSKLKEWGI